MQAGNRKHLLKVALWGGAISAAAAGATLLKYPPIISFSIMAGAAIGVFNIYSIVRLVEALAGAASEGKTTGKAAKTISTLLHILKLGIIFALLFFLVMNKMVNLFALLAGFTVVLLANLLAGFSGLKEKA